MTINSDKLVHLGDYTKELINDGVYYLFQSKDKKSVGLKYYLKTTNGHFLLLSGDGRIISQAKKVPEQMIGDHVYFNVPKDAMANSFLTTVSF